MNDLAVLNVVVPSLQMAESELIEVLQNSIYPGATIPSIKLAIGYCRALNLDPMTKPVHIVPMKVKVKKDLPNGKTKIEYVWRDVVMPGIELYRIKASRTGDYVGMAETQWGPTIEEELGGEPKEEWDDQVSAYVKGTKTWEKVKVRYPEWCQVTVFRMVHGEPRAFHSGRVYWKESYATAAGTETSLPNAMWLKRGVGQHEKCAEALALRRGFPEIGAQATADEMQGKTIDASEISSAAAPSPAIPGPQPKSANPQPAPAEKPSDAGDAPQPEADHDPERKAGSGDEKPIVEGQIKILKAKLGRAALNELDVCAKFGVASMEALKFRDFENVQAWINEKASKVV